MARAACSFKKRDVRAAVEAVIAAGSQVQRVEIDPLSGKIVVVTCNAEAPAGESRGGNEWDDI